MLTTDTVFLLWDGGKTLHIKVKKRVWTGNIIGYVRRSLIQLVHLNTHDDPYEAPLQGQMGMHQQKLHRALFLCRKDPVKTGGFLSSDMCLSS